MFRIAYFVIPSERIETILVDSFETMDWIDQTRPDPAGP